MDLGPFKFLDLEFLSDVKTVFLLSSMLGERLKV